MTDNCIKTCSQLAEELLTLKKEISKYTSGIKFSKNMSSLPEKFSKSQSKVTI